MSSASGSASISGLKIDELKVSELRALCEEQHISSAGKRSVLLRRLKDYVKQQRRREQASQAGQANLPPTPESFGPGECPAILMGSAEIGDDEDIIESAQRSLRTVLEEEELYVDRDIPQLAVGNRRGLGLAALPDKIHVLESRVTSLEKTVSIEKNTTASLQGQVNDLVMAINAYRAVRHRFLVTYKRSNIPGVELDDFDHTCIKEGNSAAHGGDAKADAELYRGFKARTDFNVYKSLYGYQPHLVWCIDHTPTLALLNLHATIKADDRQLASPKFYALFAEFLDRFEASNFNLTYLDDGNDSLVTKAYWQFRDCVKLEVKKIVPNPS